MYEKILEWDRDIFIYLNNLGAEDYDNVWLTITKFPTWIPLYLAIIVLLFWKNTLKQSVWMLLSFISMLLMLLLTTAIVKSSVGRLRPNADEIINQVIRVVHIPGDFSFFSGHAASSFSIAALAVLFLNKNFRWIHLVWIYPILFSYSRIYLGVHYPTDILVGALVGLIFAWIFYGMYRRLKAPYI